MYTMRTSVFETNSSSCHSFSITGERKFGPADYPIIKAYGDGQYNWAGPDIDSPDQLLDYALVAASYVSLSTEEFSEKLAAACEYFGLKGVHIDVGFDGMPSGYIDHRSAPGEDSDCGKIASLLNDPERLFDFVFSASVIKIDNDNHA